MRDSVNNVGMRRCLPVALSTAALSVENAKQGQGWRCSCAMPWSMHPLDFPMALCVHRCRLPHAWPCAAIPAGPACLRWGVPARTQTLGCQKEEPQHSYG